MSNPFRYLHAVAWAVFAFHAVDTLAQSKPGADTFRQVMHQRLQKLLISGYTQRDVRFVSVQAGSARNGAYPFRATIVIRDYGPGYPKNRYYGQTCVGKLVDQDYWMSPDGFGGWKVEGVMTPGLNASTCKDNPSEGVSSMPVEALEGTPAGAAAMTPSAPAPRLVPLP